MAGLLFYAASTTICCAHSLSEKGGAALGPQAGFSHFRYATETPFHLILEARR